MPRLSALLEFHIFNDHHVKEKKIYKRYKSIIIIVLKTGINSFKQFEVTRGKSRESFYQNLRGRVSVWTFYQDLELLVAHQKKAYSVKKGLPITSKVYRLNISPTAVLAVQSLA